MKTIHASLVLAALVLATPAANADVTAVYRKHCASCHGNDGSGNTRMGKKSGARDYRDAKVQASFSDAEALEAIKKGKKKMKAFSGKVSDAEAKELVKYIRAFKR